MQFYEQMAKVRFFVIRVSPSFPLRTTKPDRPITYIMFNLVQNLHVSGKHLVSPLVNCTDFINIFC